MSLQVENLEKNMAKMTVEVPAENFEKAIKTAYNNNKKACPCRQAEPKCM